MSWRYRSRSGFGLVETVIGAAIIGAVLFGAAQVGQFIFRLVDGASFKLRANFLAEEGVEVVRILRDTGWAASIAPLTICSDYYLTFSGTVWQVRVTPPALVDGLFDRRVRLEAVHRGSSDAITTVNCTLTGSDPNTRKVDVSVSWWDRGRQATTTLSTYLTNLFNN